MPSGLLPHQYASVELGKGREVDDVGCSRVRNIDMSEVKGLSWRKAFDASVFVWIRLD